MDASVLDGLSELEVAVVYLLSADSWLKWDIAAANAILVFQSKPDLIGDFKDFKIPEFPDREELKRKLATFSSIQLMQALEEDSVEASGLVDREQKRIYRERMIFLLGELINQAQAKKLMDMSKASKASMGIMLEYGMVRKGFNVYESR